MKDKNAYIHNHLDGIIAAAVSETLKDRGLASNVTKAVLDAIDNYEDDLFAKILQAEPEDAPLANLDDVKAALRS